MVALKIFPIPGRSAGAVQGPCKGSAGVESNGQEELLPSAPLSDVHT